VNLLKQRPVLRIVLLSTTSLLCVLLGSAAVQKSSSNILLKKPSVVLQASTTSITLPCPGDGESMSRACPSTAELQVALTSIAKDFNRQSTYAYTVGGGRVVGEGSKVTWDLSEAGPGIYTATVEVQDNKKHRSLSSVIVTVSFCGDCVISNWCSPITVICYDEVKTGTPITCKVVIGPTRDVPTYEWSARTWNGEDLSARISGRGKYVSIDTKGLGGQNVKTTVEVKELPPYCGRTASGSTVVKP
jgi:hypothetical protein